MATISEFGSGKEISEQGYKMVGEVQGKEEDVLAQFFSEDVVLVEGGTISDNEKSYYVCVK